MGSKLSPKCQVFVSHAGEDKKTIAIPLRDMLSEREITTFVDEKDIPPGGAATDEMTAAMEKADVAVIILSPEFVAKKWPMKELLFFLNCREKARTKGDVRPVIIPVFYRLGVADLSAEPRLDRKDADGKSLYGKTRFYERMDNGEPEADTEIIKGALRTLRGIMGVENNLRASNDVSSAPSRLLLLKDICVLIARVTEECNRDTLVDEEEPSTEGAANRFRRYFHHEPFPDVFFDFRSTGPDGAPLTPFGRIKHWLLNCERESEQVVAIHGGGGVGKSTILKGLANDEDLRQRFCDGVHFLSLGMHATVATVVQELCRILRDSGALKTEERVRNEKDADIGMREALREAISWFRGRRCAFLIDDVWTSRISAQLFSQLFHLGGAGQQGTVVFTTRELEIASQAPRDSIFRVAPREVHGTISRKILLCHAGVKPNNGEANYAEGSSTKVLEICSGLPVSLAAAGKGLKMLTIDMESQSGEAWSEYLESLKIYREQLLLENVGSYGNLYITFGASIALLEGRKDEKLRFETPASFGHMHRRLCVLKKQSKAPASMLRHLWELKSEREARVVGMRFVEVGLAESEYKRVGTTCVWHLSIHDSLHDYATAEAKRKGDVVRWHNILLDGYSRSHPDLLSLPDGRTKWWSKHLEKDGYIHENLCHHLQEAGRVEEREELMKTPAWGIQWLHHELDSITLSGSLWLQSSESSLGSVNGAQA